MPHTSSLTSSNSAILGTLANDAMIRMIGEHKSMSSTNANYLGGDMFALLSDHDTNCKAATVQSLQVRVKATVKDVENKNSIEYLHGKDKVPTATLEAIELEEMCSRDDKSHYVEEAMRRKECDCHSQFFTLSTIYRFWKCTSDAPLDDLGLADASIPSNVNGKRDFWHHDSRVHLTEEMAIEMDPSMQPYDLNFGGGKSCFFKDSSDRISLVEGRIPFEGNDYVDYSNGISLQLTSTNFTSFRSYSDLKRQVEEEYTQEHQQLEAGSRISIDPFLYDLHSSIQLIEQYGEKLEDFVYLQATEEKSIKAIEVVDYLDNVTATRFFAFSGTLDWCECQNMLKCPNGTTTNGEVGATSIDECISTKDEILHRITLLPPHNTSTATSVPSLEGTVDSSSPLHLQPYDVAVLTIDQSMLPNNLTYGEHYHISIYDGCKPCPLRYRCSAETSSCLDPPLSKQYEHLNNCLKENRKMVCLRADGRTESVENCQRILNSTDVSTNNQQLLLISEPDIKTCLSRPYFCSNSEWNSLTFRRLCQDSLPNGQLSTIYDCDDVRRWETYLQWRDKTCCSSVPVLSGIDSCDEERSVCKSNPLIEDIIRVKLIGIFEEENGYTPPIEQPLGHLLMNATLQEDRDHDQPLELFNSLNLPFETGEHNKRGQSQPWIPKEGCCNCKSHHMPHFFHLQHHVSDFPDGMHQPIQITISALEEVTIRVVVELLHGRYYAEFDDYFGAMDKSYVQIHRPKRFKDDSMTWLSIVEKSTFDNLNLDLPLNLPFSKREYTESRFLLDRPSNHTIGSPDFQSIGEVAKLSDPTLDPFELGNHVDNWSHDFISLPYLPFLSNCDGYDSHISLSRLLEEHPDCETVDFEETMPTKEYAFWGKNPVSDTCLGVILQCTYEEKITETRNNLRWFEALPKSKLFYIVSISIASALR